MLIISHRGNINGPDPLLENHPYYVNKVLQLGVPCEVDVWWDGINFYLGHDGPDHVVVQDFFRTENLWCHAKNLLALQKMLSMGVHCFWHEEDKYTLTSKGYVWAYPDQPVKENCIIVDLSPNWTDKGYSCHGVCTDYVLLDE